MTKRTYETIAALAAPLTIGARPFLAAARRLGVSERTLLARLRGLMKSGVVRRVGVAVNHRRAGYRHNALVAWEVAAGRRTKAARFFSSREEVSHCYRRRVLPGWPYSLYTMVHGRSRAECRACARAMARAAGVSGYRMLFTVKEYKKAKTDIAAILGEPC